MTDKSRTHGPKPLDAKDKRTHTVSVRLNAAELDQLDSLRADRKMQRGAYLRTAFLKSLPPVVPEINKQAWLELSKAAANLNQLSKKMNVVGMVEASLIMRELADFRATLLRAAKK
ncbi:MAG: mobilization protein [Methyloprofundus sp.]|nr:mobilization protein [Methyloprofundus sp.]